MKAMTSRQFSPPPNIRAAQKQRPIQSNRRDRHAGRLVGGLGGNQGATGLNYWPPLASSRKYCIKRYRLLEQGLEQLGINISGCKWGP